jgi:hypothetical protein
LSSVYDLSATLTWLYFGVGAALFAAFPIVALLAKRRAFAAIGAGALLVFVASASPTISRALAPPERGIVEKVRRASPGTRGNADTFIVTCRARGVAITSTLQDAPAIGATLPVRIGALSSQIGDDATTSAFAPLLTFAAFGVMVSLYRKRRAAAAK